MKFSIRYLKEIRAFTEIKSNLYFVQDKVLKYKFHQNNEEIPFKGTYIKNVVDRFCVTGYDYYLDIATNKIVSPKSIHNYYFTLINNNELMLYNSSSEFLIYNIVTSETLNRFSLSENKGISKIINEDRFIIVNESNDISLENSSNEVFWNNIFNVLAQSDTVYGPDKILENNGKLYFTLSSRQGKSGLFVLDVETGEQISFFDKLKFALSKDEEFIYTSEYQNNFCRINTNTQEKEEYPINELIKENGFESVHDHRFTVKKGILYFTQSMGGPTAKLGVIDLENQKMLYTYDFPISSGAIGSIQVNQGRIYIHTQDKTLHIFEPED